MKIIGMEEGDKIYDKHKNEINKKIKKSAF